MNKNYQVIIRKKREQKTCSEDVLSILDINNEIVADREMKDIFMNKIHIGPNAIRELEEFEERKRKEKEEGREKEDHRDKEEKGKEKEGHRNKEGKGREKEDHRDKEEKGKEKEDHRDKEEKGKEKESHRDKEEKGREKEDHRDKEEKGKEKEDHRDKEGEGGEKEDHRDKEEKGKEKEDHRDKEGKGREKEDHRDKEEKGKEKEDHRDKEGKGREKEDHRDKEEKGKEKEDKKDNEEKGKEKEGHRDKEEKGREKEGKKDNEENEYIKKYKINPFVEYNLGKQNSKKRMELINYNDKNILHGRGQVYRSKKINIDKPKKDVVINIGDIDRDIYIESVEMLNDGANILAMVVENITYYTAKPLPPKPEKEEEPKLKKHSTCESFEKECICLDGVVRNTTVITPCLIYLDIIGANESNSYEVESASVECINTSYVLDDGTIVDSRNLPMGRYIESLMEGYVITISIIAK